MNGSQLIDHIYQARMWARSQAWPNDFTYVLSMDQADLVADHIRFTWGDVGVKWIGIRGKDLDGGDIFGARIAVV